MSMIRLALLTISAASLTGCLASNPVMGDASAKTAATGSAAGASASNANPQLQRCDSPMGTMSILEGQSRYTNTLGRYGLGSPEPVLRLLVQQSNCFVVVERGAALNQMSQERQLMQSGEMRSGSNFGKGQMVAADYTMTPSVTFSANDTGGIGGALSRFSGGLGVFGQLAGGLKFREASTMLTMIDNRSGVQLAAAEGSSKSTDYNLWAGLFGGRGGGSLGGYTKTPEGKVVAAAFADAYNQLVDAVRNYRAQEVKGGLGTGGRLGVQGGSTPGSRKQ
ncbi:MAG: CsgG/HfaB family protein [Burkholderiaceae bacterium]